MGEDGLFEELPETAPRGLADKGGRPRLREPVRDQLELRAVDIDSLIGSDHPARVIWAYAGRLDPSALEDRIKAREGVAGHPPIAPRLLVAPWLYATSDGVGSARALERLCSSHDAYRWLCGGVSVNHHTLGDFRVAHPDLLDELLARNVAALASAGVIDLDEAARDGMRVRAAAGSASFRWRGTLETHLERARRRVKKLKREVGDDPDASNRRIKAARERLARVEQALEALGRIEARRAPETAKDEDEEKNKKRAPRASTTDPEARVIKMADGGFRPGYNMQIASAAGSQIILGVDVTASGSDRGLMRPMIERIGDRHGHRPRRYLADGGFTKNDDIEWAARAGTLVHCPPITNRHGTDPLAPRATDTPGVAAWRRRMKSPAGKARYKRRAICECVNARARQWNLRQITVRGRDKAHTILLRFALANNILQRHRLTSATTT